MMSFKIDEKYNASIRNVQWMIWNVTKTVCNLLKSSVCKFARETSHETTP